MTLIIKIENAEEVSDQLADLACWWSGYRAGLKMSDREESMIPFLKSPERGMEAVKLLKCAIEDQLAQVHKRADK